MAGHDSRVAITDLNARSHQERQSRMTRRVRRVVEEQERHQQMKDDGKCGATLPSVESYESHNGRLSSSSSRHSNNSRYASSSNGSTTSSRRGGALTPTSDGRSSRSSSNRSGDSGSRSAQDARASSASPAKKKKKKKKERALTNEEKLERVHELLADHRLLDAARLVLEIDDKSLLRQEHYDLLQEAREFEMAVEDLTGAADASWTKQGESHGKYDTEIFYKVEEGAKLFCRIETPIPASLLIPLLSVLNEVELYQTWVPSFTFPRIGISKSCRLKQIDLTDQIFQLLVNVPWPFATRDAVIRAHAIDEIQSRGHIVVRMTTPPPPDMDGDEDEEEFPPPPEKGVTRVDFDGSMLFRACPPDHPLLLKSKRKRKDPMILVALKMSFDPKMTGVPKSVINFVTRTVIGECWRMLLSVAESVRNGKRPQHERVIESRAEMYNFFRSKIDAMIVNLMKKQQQQEASSSSNSNHEEDDHKYISYLQG